MAFKTSDAYKNEINKLTRDSKISGKLTTVNGNVIDINNDIISSGSFYITNQCVSSDSFSYGSVFSAELGISLKTNIDRYSLFDAKIELSYNLLISSDLYEEIPLGIFYVNEPTRSGNTISIKAYDNMLKLDMQIIENFVGTPFEMLLVIQNNCNIELAQTEDEIKSFVNGEHEISLDKEKVKTYRDLLSYICLMTCSFAVFDRYGKLKLCKYSNELNFEINSSLRKSSKYSDFTTYYSKVRAKFLEAETYVDYFSGDDGDGLTYNLGEVPIVQGLRAGNQKVLDAIFESLKSVNYVPCEITISGDPSIDLGDMITNTDANGNEYTSLVTFYKWTYRGSEQIKSAGGNPKLSNREEDDSGVTMSDVTSEIAKKSMQVFTYTNAKEIKLSHAVQLTKFSKVVKINFSSIENTTAVLIVTAPIYLYNDGWVEFKVVLDSAEFENNTFVQYCEKGDNIISFCTYIPCQEYKTYKLEVRARTHNNTVSRLREYDAQLKTNNNAIEAIVSAFNNVSDKLSSSSSLPISDLGTITYTEEKPDYSHTSGFIGEFAVKAVVIGQGFFGEEPWDGTIDMEEVFSSFRIDRYDIAVKGFDDEISSEMRSNKGASISEALETLNLGSIIVDNVNAVFEGNETVTNYTFETEKANIYSFDRDAFIFESEFKLKTEDVVEGGNEISIDSGKAIVLAIDKTKYLSVSDIRIEVV